METGGLCTNAHVNQPIVTTLYYPTDVSFVAQTLIFRTSTVSSCSSIFIDLRTDVHSHLLISTDMPKDETGEGSLCSEADSATSKQQQRISRGEVTN
jgi:hypothetical protein